MRSTNALHLGLHWLQVSFWRIIFSTSYVLSHTIKKAHVKGELAVSLDCGKARVQKGRSPTLFSFHREKDASGIEL